MTDLAQEAPAENCQPQRHRIALCLGAHRSGTSLVSAALEAVGAELALPDRITSEENPKGFFEHLGVVRLNDDLLALAHSAWDDPLFDGRDMGVTDADAMAGIDSRADEFAARFRAAPLAAVKDPRMCRLLPFWFDRLAQAGYGDDDIRCVLVTRSPVEIAISQRTRCRKNTDFYEYGRELAEGAALWLNHIRQALRDCAGRPILIIGYHHFVANAPELLPRIAGFLDAPPRAQDLDTFTSRFIDRDLWRSQPDEAAAAEIEAALPGILAAEQALSDLSGRVVTDAEIAPILAALESAELDLAVNRIAARAYGRLAGLRRNEREEALGTKQALAATRQDRDAIAHDRRQIVETTNAQIANLNARIAGLNAALIEAERVKTGQQSQIHKLNDQIIASTGQLEYMKQVNEALQSSLSWRVTAPLREAGTMARKMRGVPGEGLRALNRASQVTHQRLKRTHPRTAEILRRNIQPLMSRANMKILGQHSVPARAAPPSPNPPGLEGLPPGMYAMDFQSTGIEAEFRPLVSVIVPNYNHAEYLTQRLESIYAQSYDNFEVLLLDDCSSDDSRKVLEDFAARYPERTQLLFNETNSGGVFRQWEKGLAAARGDLIWIAESDDWASENFLEALVPFFRNEALQLAYARSVFMDGAGEKQIWSMEEYLNEYSPERWSKPWIATGPEIVRDVFSMTNIVPNVSSALFRRIDRLDALEIDEWRGMRTCGDWMFYLNILRGGMMAYSTEAQNYYRIHDRNTSVSSHKADQFYREHESVAKCLRRHYRVPARNLDRMTANLRHHWKITRDDYSDAAFRDCFDPARIKAAPERKPGLLMASYGFCAGGGETFPIQLANEMKAIGYDVTFLDCVQEERVEGVRAMLARDIPVITNFADLKRIVRLFDIDLIHSHHGWVDNTMLDLLPADSPCKTVVTLHGFYETIPPAQLHLLLRRLMLRTGGMVYTADKNLGAIREAGLIDRRELHRIDNALSKSAITPIDRATLGIAPDAFLLTLVSRALPTKGWPEAVASVTRARELSGKDIQLILIGEGEARRTVEAANPPDHIHMLGFRDNIRDFYAASDLGFLPSRFPGESFPLVIIDSLNAGTPVLASDIGEISYMLTTDAGPAGALFSLDEDWQIDTEALARLIADLASDQDRMRELRQRVPAAAERFDPRRMAQNYDKVYLATTGTTKERK